MQGPEWALFPSTLWSGFLPELNQPVPSIVLSFCFQKVMNSDCSPAALFEGGVSTSLARFVQRCSLPGEGLLQLRGPQVPPPFWSGLNAGQSVQISRGCVILAEEAIQRKESCRSTPHRHSVLYMSGHQQKAARLTATAQAVSKSLNSGGQVTSPLWPSLALAINKLPGWGDETKYTLYSFSMLLQHFATAEIISRGLISFPAGNQSSVWWVEKTVFRNGGDS